MCDNACGLQRIKRQLLSGQQLRFEIHQHAYKPHLGTLLYITINQWSVLHDHYKCYKIICSKKQSHLTRRNCSVYNITACIETCGLHAVLDWINKNPEFLDLFK